MKIRPIYFSVILILLSCEQQNELYDVKGTVRSIDIESNNVIIAHDTIVDLMMPHGYAI
jgi:hypothetical protein